MNARTTARRRDERYGPRAARDQEARCRMQDATERQRQRANALLRMARTAPRIVDRVGYIKPYPTENPTHRQAQAGDDRKRVKTLQVHARGSCPVSRGPAVPGSCACRSKALFRVYAVCADKSDLTGLKF